MYVSVKEAALLLGKSEAWVKLQAKLGLLEAIHVVGYNNRLVWQIKSDSIQSFDAVLAEFNAALTSGEGFQKAYARKTISQHECFIRWLFRWAGLEPHLKHFNLTTLKKAFAHLCHTAPCAYSRKDNLIKSYRCFGKWLAAKGFVSTSVLDGLDELKPKRFTPARRTKLTKDKLQQLFQLVEQHFEDTYHKQRFRLFLFLLSQTGLRANEALSLQWSQVDFTNGLISVVGKGNKPRIVPLPDSLKLALTNWKQAHWQRGTLFNNWTYNAARITLQRFRKHLPFDITYHGLRRTAATLWVEQYQAPITQVQKLLGHSNITTTQLYIEADAMEAVRFINSRAS